MPGMAHRETPSAESADSEHRSRLLQGMALVATRKGFAATTIADVVREAGVSKRTFYEHFDSKDSCFLALYEAVSMNALRRLKEVVSPQRAWRPQLDQALEAYLSHMAANPELLRTLFIDIHHLGQAGERVRRQVMTALSGFMNEVIGREAEGGPMGAGLALAAVGGINELILEAIEQGRAAELPAMTSLASEVVRRLAGPIPP